MIERQLGMSKHSIAKLEVIQMQSETWFEIQMKLDVHIGFGGSDSVEDPDAVSGPNLEFRCKPSDYAGNLGHLRSGARLISAKFNFNTNKNTNINQNLIKPNEPETLRLRATLDQWAVY